MKLLKLICKSIIQNDWELTELSLNPTINLLVAQNATGKSTTIKHIRQLSQILKGVDIASSFPIIGYECVFQNDKNNILRYSIKTILTGKADEDSEAHFTEELHFDDKLVLTRHGKEAKIYSMKQNEFTRISPPKNKLVIHVRRDTVEYPFFEDLMDWAQDTELFEFSRISPLQNKSIDNYNIGELLSKLSSKQNKLIVDDLNNIGYEIESIKTMYFNEEHIISLKEKGIENEVPQKRISQGLFRALSVLIFIDYYLQNNKVATVLIDDLCEGLDYERATKLGKLLVAKFENSNIQFICTTNDSFLMDVIPIKYWNILERESNVVKNFNYQNSQKAFDKFKMSGLSNFYLFTSNFLHQTF